MTNPFSNSFYLLTPLISAGIITALVILVLQKAHRDFSRVVFVGFLMGFAVQSLMTFGMRSSADIYQATPWDKALAIAALSAFALYYHFTFAYANISRRRWLFPAIYSFIAGVTILQDSTDLVLKGMSLQSYGYAPVVGPLVFLIYGPMMFFMIGGCYNLLHAYGASPSYEERNRLLYLAIAVAFPLLGGGLDGFTDLPPASMWANLIFAILCSVAILRYHILDIRLVVQKTLVYVVVSAAIAVPYVGILLAVSRIFKTVEQPWWLYGILILLFAIILRPLYTWAQRLVDRLFYRERYDYLKALMRFVGEAQSIVDLNQLCSTMIQLVIGALRVSSVSLLLPSEKGDFMLEGSEGLDNPPSRAVLSSHSLLVKWLKGHSDILSSEDLDVLPLLQDIATVEKANLEGMGAKLYVPIKAREGQLSGLLILGQKLSQQSYSAEDRRLLAALSGQLAMVLENARLYGDAVRARNNLQTWLNSMNDCVIIVAENLHIQFANRAALERFGDCESSVCWRALGVERECRYCPMHRSKGGDKENVPYNVEFGSRQYEISVAPLQNPDSTTSVIEILRDVTERNRAETYRRMLEQKAQLASRLASVGEMASGIAHEINNPLTGVIGFAQLLMQKDIPEDIRNDVKVINDGAQRVGSIVKRLLTFARRYKPERTLLDVNEIILNTLELRAYHLRTSNIEVTTVLDPNLTKTVADGGQLQQVFLNVIINAETEMKLAHGRGKLLIKTERAEEIIKISFVDDGPGIAKENMERIFEPFFTTREVGQGTGLGLAVCYGIMSEHGGRIYAESELGKGATFIVELPMTAEEQHTELGGTVVEEVGKVGGSKILVVDDELAIRDLISEVLTREGHQVETVDNAVEALNRLKSNRYSLMLLDIKLPGMSGIELYKRIEEVVPALVGKTVFITGDVMAADTMDFIASRGVPYITKPFDIHQLKQVVNGLSGTVQPSKE